MTAAESAVSSGDKRIGTSRQPRQRGVVGQLTVVCNIALSSGSCRRSPRAATATESGDCRLESTVGNQ